MAQASKWIWIGPCIRNRTTQATISQNIRWRFNINLRIKTTPRATGNPIDRELLPRHDEPRWVNSQKGTECQQKILGGMHDW